MHKTFKTDNYNGVLSFRDYDSSLAYAKCVNKPLFVFFTCWACSGTRKMEESVFPTYWIKRKLNNDFVQVSLFVDDQKPIKDSFYSGYLKRLAVTQGDRDFHFQISKFKTNTQPFFAVLDTNENILGTFAYTPDKKKVEKYLKDAYRLFERQQ